MYFIILFFNGGACGGVVEALCYKLEGHGFSSDETIGFFSIDLILPATLLP
jgi:hypothetical protein